jgi:hypothetical protein
MTGHSCYPPCDPADPRYPNCNNRQYSYCGTQGSSYPEVRARAGAAGAAPGAAGLVAGSYFLLVTNAALSAYPKP